MNTLLVCTASTTNSIIHGIHVDSKNETYEMQKYYQSDSIQSQGMTVGIILFLFFSFLFSGMYNVPRRRNNKKVRPF